MTAGALAAGAGVAVSGSWAAADPLRASRKGEREDRACSSHH